MVFSNFNPIYKERNKIYVTPKENAYEVPIT